MLRNGKGYLLLEGMLAIFIITSAILMTIGGMVFMLNDEKKSQDNLEMAIYLFEMEMATKNQHENHPAILKKGFDNQIDIEKWQKNHLVIKKERTVLEVFKK